MTQDKKPLTIEDLAQEYANKNVQQFETPEYHMVLEIGFVAGFNTAKEHPELLRDLFVKFVQYAEKWPPAREIIMKKFDNWIEYLEQRNKPI